MNLTLLAIAQRALDQALRLDPQAGSILAPLAGKRVAVQIVGAVPARVIVAFSHERICLVPLTEQVADIVESGPQDPPDPVLSGEADVCICGSASALAMLARGGGELPSAAQVKVSGDVALLQQMRVALTRLRPDFDEPLARLLGDELAYPLSRVVRELASMAQRTVVEIGADVQEFLSEESELLAPRDEVQVFGDEVDRLRDALARLDKRVSRLASTLGPSTQ